MTTSVADYEVRLSETRKDGSKWTSDDMIKVFNSLCKDWTFNLEKGEETGYMHFQCSIRLRKRTTKNALLKLFTSLMQCETCDAPQYIAPCVKGVHSTAFNFNCYAAKAQTAVASYNSKDCVNYVPKFIPDQFKGFIDNLRPYQKYIFDSPKIAREIDPRYRNIFYVYQPEGDIGKSITASLCALYGNGVILPPLNDSEKIIQLLCNICIDRDLRSPNPLILDLPKSNEQSKLPGLYSAIEQIKNGYLCDTRHHYKDWWINSPIIWVFSNELPDRRYLSGDRWKIFEINETFELIPYVEKPLDVDHDKRVFDKSLFSKLPEGHYLKPEADKIEQKILDKKSKTIKTMKVQKFDFEKLV